MKALSAPGTYSAGYLDGYFNDTAFSNGGGDTGTFTIAPAPAVLPATVTFSCSRC